MIDSFKYLLYIIIGLLGIAAVYLLTEVSRFFHNAIVVNAIID